MTPETEEYGIGSFVYRSRTPFHPRRFQEFVESIFVVTFWEDGPEEEEEVSEGLFFWLKRLMLWGKFVFLTFSFGYSRGFFWHFRAKGFLVSKGGRSENPNL